MCLSKLEKEDNDHKYPYIVDCFINKFEYMFHKIPKYILYLNRYNFNLKITESGNLELDFTYVDKYFNDMLNLYLIEKEEVDYSSLEDYSFEKNIILPCDSFYLPYSSQNYLKFHLEHNILLKRNVKDSFFIYDDNPFFSGYLKKDIICKAYKILNKKIYIYSCGSNFKSNHIKSFFLEHALNYKFNFFETLEEYINLGYTERKIVQNLNELRIPLKRFEAFLVICISLANETKYDDVENCIKVAERLNNEMKLFSNLVSIGLRNPEKDILRIVKRCNVGKKKETELKEEFSIMISKMEKDNVEI